MNMKTKKAIFLLIFSVMMTVSCYGRVPRPTSAHHVIKKHFRSYGKKYKESDFGKFKVAKIEILDTREIQKDLSEVEAYVILGNSEKIYKVRVTMQKKTFGWKCTGWETLGSQ